MPGARNFSRVTCDRSHAKPRRRAMETCFGGERIVDMLVGDQSPRIC